MRIKTFNESITDELPLIVLDLDENLIHSVWKNYEEVPYSYIHAHKILHDSVLIKKRPHVQEFLDYVFDNFRVAVWTAASRDYATEVLQFLGIDQSKLEFFHSEKNCTVKYDLDTGELIYIKDLNKLKRHFPLEKTLIIDDNPKGCTRNYGNLLRTKAWYGEDNDEELLKVIKYLERIKDEPNYRSIEKRGWASGL